MSSPALLAVAHGSRNPAAADVVRKVAKQIARLAPVLDVRVAFLDHAEPSLPAQLDAAGQGAVIVPLLLSSGYHLSADIAAAAHISGARVAASLGPDQLLLTALTARLAEASVPEGTPVVLAAAERYAGRRVAIASYLLAPGHFQDQLTDCGADWVTAPLGGHPALAGLAIDRYRAAARSK